MKNKIKEYREELGITQAELAEKSGICRTIINQLENDKRPVIKSDTMIKLSCALGKSIEQIFLM